ncbi:MAG: asparaginase [Ancalomicrobiaceae bacterium]|nr:asparaginase [Ancalomicrobiaceae bacterium]
MADNPVIVEVLRGAMVESRHRGSVAVVDADGGIAFQLGDIEQPTFPRSAVKVIQALPLVESGAADAYHLTQAELAFACASHNGEPLHTETALSMLTKAGRDASVLECGAHWPSRPEDIGALFAAGALKPNGSLAGSGPGTTGPLMGSGPRPTGSLAGSGPRPTALHNNCSGKHSGFICFCCHCGEDPAGYVKPEHFVQRHVTDALADVTGSLLSADVCGTDGCSIPTYAMPLKNIARGFAKLATGIGLKPIRAAAAKRLFAAVLAEPFMVAGTDRFCTKFMQALGTRVFVKVGAEGVYCGAIPELGLGIALKCDDGAARAAEVAMAAVVARLLRLNGEPTLADFLEPTLTNWNGIRVGALRPAGALLA